jgi:Na+/H+ antiporter NhaC
MATKIYRRQLACPSFFIVILFILALGAPLQADQAIQAEPLKVSTPSFVLTGVETKITVSQIDPKSALPVQFKISQNNQTLSSGVITPATAYQFPLTLNKPGANHLKLQIGTLTTDFQVNALNGALTILPPLAVIAISILTKQIFFPLLIGIYLTGLILHQFNPLLALTQIFDTHIIQNLINPQYAHSILFLLITGALLSPILSMFKTALQPRLTHKSTVISTLLLSLGFFYNYALNILTIGTLAAPLAQKNKVSKEMFAYIINVASTTLAGLFTFATVLTINLTPIQATLDGINPSSIDLHQLLLQGMPFKFYTILTLFFIAFTALSGKNFGPMLQGKNQPTPQSQPTPQKPSLKPFLAIIILILLAATLSISELSLQPPPTNALLCHSFNCLHLPIVLITLAIFALATMQKKITPQKFKNLWLLGFKNTSTIVATLVLVWVFADLSLQIDTPSYLASFISKTIPHWLLPTIFFIIAFITAIFTGSMHIPAAILLPIALPIVYHQNLQFYNLELAALASPPLLISFLKQALLLNLAAIFEGALFGIHCSPIAPNTILMAHVAKINILRHLKAQVPYTFLVGFITILFCYLPAGLGISPYLLLAVTFMIIATFLLAFGKNVNETLQSSQAEDVPPQAEQ